MKPDDLLDDFCNIFVEGWNCLVGIGNAIAECVHDVCEWCKEHWKVVAAVIVIVAIGVAAILTGGTLAAILAAAFWGALKGAAVGAILGGLASIVEGESFWNGFENGLLFGALFGGAFGALGKAAQLLGSSCKFLSESSTGQFLVSHFMTVLKVAKYSGRISLSMFGFDILALGSGLAFGKDNWLTSVNRELHQNGFYNAFQFSVSILAVASGGLTKGMQNPTCFIAGTPVLTANGLVAIENIKEGDTVLAMNALSGEISKKTVLKTYRRNAYELVHLFVHGEEIVTTLNHPFYVVGKGFVNAGNLNIRDSLLDVKRQPISISGMAFESAESRISVYNFEVDCDHTYFVGKGMFLVHNADALYRRGSFRRSTRVKAESEAPRNENGKMICPTCGKEIPESFTVQTKNGPISRVGYDLDHYPETWAQRVDNLQSQLTAPTRAEILDLFNTDVRVQCHECNISHLFEGVEGDYAKP